MLEEKQQAGQQHLADFIEKLRSAASDNLVCLAVYGSAASQDFHPAFSDINMLCVLRDVSQSSLQALEPAILSWIDHKYPAPLVFAQQEIERDADIFPIEMLDIRRQHQVLFGRDIFKDLKIPMERHRNQLEHELRTKLLLLRQRYLLSRGDQSKIGLLMLDSLSSFSTLFRHVLLTMGQDPPATKREVIEELAVKVQVDPSPFLELLQVREGKSQARSLDAQAVFARYLRGIERVIQAVDAL
jgi:hypothetical protein